jgi:type I restriction enzyme S subunit
MRDEWLTRTVRELQDEGVLLVEDGNHGENRPRPDEFNSEGVAFIRAADMDAGRILFATASRINDIALARIRKGVGRPGDILLSHKGTVGKLAVAPDDCEPFVCSPQTTFWRVLDNKALDRRFLYFFMRSRAFRQQLDSVKGETDMADYASLTAQRRFYVPIIELNLQKSIASVLGALDDKIDLNHRMNVTLEAMARAIFKDWFVDFGPTRAKMEGRAPYVASEIWALFPDRLDDEGRPEGWSIGTMSDLLLLQRGFDLPSQARRDGPYPIIAASGPNGFHDCYMVSGPGVTTGRSGVLGNVFFIQENFWPLNTSLWVKEFRRATPSFAYFYLCNIDFAAFNAGSAVPTLNRNHIHGLPVVLPPDLLVSAFDNTAMPLLRRHRHNIVEAETIEATRDLLLPKLMSGKISLRDAEKMVEAVA